jgi:hypothetical protein
MNMKPNRLILTILITTCFLLLHAGCEEEAVAPRQTLSDDWFRQFNQIQQSGSPRTTTRTRFQRRAPKLEFEKLEHDFGYVGPRTNNLCEFRFTNAGNSPLKIGEITNTCGCTPFSLAKKEYAPGESGILKVNYLSEQLRGQTTKQLVIHSNDRARPKVTLAIKANIKMQVSHEPKTLNLLLKQENANCPQLTLASIDNQPFSIKSFKSTGNCITADFNPSEQATKFILQPKVDMERLEKTLNGRIEIDLTHPECKTISVGIRTLPKFKIHPRSLVVRGMAKQQPIVQKLRILNNYNEDFELESVSLRNGAVKVLSNAIVNKGYELELQITPPASKNTKRIFNETLFVKTKEGQRLEIPCNVYYSRTIPASLKATTKEDDKECKTCGHNLLDFTKGTVTTFPATE